MLFLYTGFSRIVHTVFVEHLCFPTGRYVSRMHWLSLFITASGNKTNRRKHLSLADSDDGPPCPVGQFTCRVNCGHGSGYPSRSKFASPDPIVKRGVTGHSFSIVVAHRWPHEEGLLELKTMHEHYITFVYLLDVSCYAFLILFGCTGVSGFDSKLCIYSRFYQLALIRRFSCARSYPVFQVECFNFNQRLNGCISGLF